MPHGVLRELADLDEPSLLDALRELVSSDLLVGDEQEDTYAFRHVLVGDAVRDGMLPVERRRLHAACARSVESRLGAATTDEDRRLLGMLPRHWTEAGRLDLALSAAVRAAEATAVVAPDVAAAHYARAVELDARLPARPRRAAGRNARTVRAGPRRPSRAVRSCSSGWPSSAAPRGTVPAATESARAALELVTRLGVRRRSPPTQPGRPACTGSSPSTARACSPTPRSSRPSRPQCRRPRSWARRRSWRRPWPRRPGTSWSLDHNARAVPLSRRAREIAVSVGAEPEEAFAAATLGSSLCYLGSFDEGLETLAYAVPALEAAHRPYDAARALLTLVWAQFHGGDPQTGRASAERAAAALREGRWPARPRGPARSGRARDGRRVRPVGRAGRRAGPSWTPPGRPTRPRRSRSIEGALLRSVRAELALRRGRQERGGARATARCSRTGSDSGCRPTTPRPSPGSPRSQPRAVRPRRRPAASSTQGLDAVEAADTWVAVLGYARAGLAVEAAAARAGRPVDAALRRQALTALLDRGRAGRAAGVGRRGRAGDGPG